MFEVDEIKRMVDECTTEELNRIRGYITLVLDSRESALRGEITPANLPKL